MSSNLKFFYVTGDKPVVTPHSRFGMIITLSAQGIGDIGVGDIVYPEQHDYIHLKILDQTDNFFVLVPVHPHNRYHWQRELPDERILGYRMIVRQKKPKMIGWIESVVKKVHRHYTHNWYIS